MKTRETVVYEFADETIARHYHRLNSSKKEDLRQRTLQKQHEPISRIFSQAHKLIQ